MDGSARFFVGVIDSENYVEGDREEAEKVNAKKDFGEEEVVAFKVSEFDVVSEDQTEIQKFNKNQTKSLYHWIVRESD